MNSNLQSLCDKFIQNRDMIQENFAWDSSLIFPACAMIFVDKNSTADGDKYDTNFELASLGLLATLDVNRKEVIAKPVRQHLWVLQYLLLSHSKLLL